MRNTRLAVVFAVALVAAPLAGCVTDNAGAIHLTLKLGSLMPLTGAQAARGPSMQDGARLAVGLVNAANAGLRIDASYEDGTTSDKAAAAAAFNRLVSADGVTAVVGPCCGDVAAAVLDLAKQKQVVVASPATAPNLTDSPTPYFWRVAPSDAQQGKVLAKVVAQDGAQRVGLVVADDAYGNALEREFRAAFSGTVLVAAKYDPSSPGDMSAQAAQACAPPLAQAVVLFAYVADAANALQAMQKLGCLSKVKVYGSDALGDPTLASRAGKDASGKWLARGVKGTAPGVPDGFRSIYKTEYGDEPRPFAAESFDAVMYLALAAVAGKSVAGKDVQANLVHVANTPGGKYRGDQFKDAAEALLHGEDIDYQGYAHDFGFDETKREPTGGVYDLWAISESGELTTVQAGVSS